ncbi:MAG: DUF2804 domain-containing protein [Treponema sp.]|nr:DUF2804 domain-containing protein [Treponema sp.]
MYTRKLEEKISHIVSKGKASFGSFSEVSPRLDIKGMRSPYAGVPLPAFISNLRIKSRIFYTFSFDENIGMVDFFDFKAFGLTEVIVWDKKTGKKCVYHNIMPPRRRFVPTNTADGSCTCFRKSRFTRIHWKNNHQKFRVDISLKGDKVRPNLFAKIRSSEITSSMMFVAPAPTSSRCTASWFSTMKITGRMDTHDSTLSNAQEMTGLACQSLSRAYYKFHTNQTWALGIGNLKGKDVIFHMLHSNLDAADENNYNHNELIIDGETTLLPPVVITTPFGISKTWVIQDTENMVDLTFTPLSLQSRTLNIIIMRTEYSSIYGTFDGVLLDKNGEKLVLKNFPGLVYKNRIRTL